MRVTTFKKLAIVSAIALLTGCGGSDQDISLDAVEPTAEQLKASSAVVIMDFANGNIPFPHDALFSGSTDGTLNIPVDDADDLSDPAVALNAIDGFSTSAPITFSLTKALNEADLNTNTIADILETGLAVYEASTTIVNGSNVVTGVASTLIPGVDYYPKVVNSTTVAVVPLKPLNPATTYIVVAKNALQDVDGNPVARSANYQALASSEPLTGSLASLEPLRQLTNAHLTALESNGEVVDDIVGSWTFTTQSIGAVLTQLNQDAAAASVAVNIIDDENVAISTTTLGLSGAAKLYRGYVNLPYYSTAASSQYDPAPLQTYWLGQGGSLLSKYNTAPVKTTDVTVPLIFTKPNGGTKPANGWPVVIFQHGITANRTSVVAIADTLAQAGYASIAIDMPLHGIADSSSTSAALFGISDAEVSGIEERHFNLDLVAQDANGSITASGPDSVVDSSGRHFINLSSLLTTRDNLRQAVSDLMHLKAGLASFNGLGSSVIDASKVSFIGHSLGAMVGGVYANFATDLESAVFANGGTQAAYLLAGSPVFGPEIASGLAAQGVAPGSADFSQFLIAAQTVIDTTDPLNHVAQLSVPSAVFEVVGDGSSSYPSDQVVPNSVTGAPLAGTDPWRALQALPTISASGATTGKAALLFTQGGHSSLLDPAESLLVTQTMQEAAASFTATQGTAIQVSDSTTLQ